MAYALRDLFVSQDFDKPSKVSFQGFSTKTYKGQITWRLQKSDLNKQCGMHKECKFSIGEPNFCKVRFRIYPSGKTNEFQEFLAFSLSLLEKVPEHMGYHCAISIVDINEQFQNSKVDSSRGLAVDEINFDNFLPKQEVENCLVENKLIVHCRLEIYQNSYFAESDDMTFKCDDFKSHKPLLQKHVKDIPCDAHIEIEGKRILINKALLMSEVPHFNITFRGAPDDEMCFKPSWNVKAHTMEKILNFIYTDNLSILNFNEACKLYSAAHLLQLSNLKDICAAYLIANKNKDNVHILKFLADKHKDDELESAYVKFFKLTKPV